MEQRHTQQTQQIEQKHTTQQKQMEAAPGAAATCTETGEPPSCGKAALT